MTDSEMPSAVSFSEPPQPGEYRQALQALADELSACAGFEPIPLQQRVNTLMRIARHDMGLARLAEGHADAISILKEAGQTPVAGALYAIWASGGPADTTRLDGTRAQTLSGAKPFCSGAGLVDRALIWVSSAHALIEVDLASHAARVAWDSSAWRVAGLAGIQTWQGEFDTVPVEATVGNGDRDWYFERAGFWLGALCPAACWAGGASGLLDYAASMVRDDAISRAHMGRMLSASFGMESALRAAAAPVADGMTSLQSAHARALAARHLTERASAQIIDEFSRLLGPRPLINVPSVARRIQELQIFQRQCHGDRDLAELAAVAGSAGRAEE